MCEQRRLAVRFMVVACLLACLAACATGPEEHRGVCLRLAGSDRLNPDRDGRPSPVIVRIYQLSEADDFRQAGFFDLYGNDRQLLGKAMLARSVLAIRPGQRIKLGQALVPGTRYLAVLVAYRDIWRARWRAVVALPDQSEDGDSDWLLTLHPDKLTITPHGGGNDKGSWKEGSHVLEQ